MPQLYKNVNTPRDYRIFIIWCQTPQNVFIGSSMHKLLSRKFVIRIMKVLKDKVVVITGGATGIGLEIADQFLKKDAKVIILLDINEKQGVESVNNLNLKYGPQKSVFYKCDVTKDLDAVTKTIYDTYGYVDILVNNAGVCKELEVEKTIDINVTALIKWSFEYWKRMRTDKGGNGGTIINLASIYGFRADQFLPVYQSSKFAVMGFTKSLGHEYNFKRSGVRVVAICPGYTYTSLTTKIDTWDNEGISQDYSTFLKQQEFQKVEFVGKAAIEVFENADSGTAWLVEGSRPAVLVS